ncbi:hypothetical protein CPB86DRAFT_820180 [Serendipita vermifera]|nr:hypothetical protein CPB86DRAFT_820180 [Serendipita vermifera]
MSSILATQRPPTPRDLIVLLTICFVPPTSIGLYPRNGPHLIHQFFLNYIPNASLVQPNILSDSDALSILCYTLITSPESTHAWVIFKFFHEEALRANAGVDLPPTSQSSPFVFPPSPLLADISKAVVNFWKVFEIADWAELACDVRNAHTQLVASFGNGVIFDGKDWEEQRHYHASSLYFKWMGYQATYGITTQ